MPKKTILVLVFVLLLGILSFVSYKVYSVITLKKVSVQNEPNSPAETTESAFGNLVASTGSNKDPVYADENGNGYYFNFNNDYNLKQDFTGVLKSVSDGKIVFVTKVGERDTDIEIAYDRDPGFLVYCRSESLTIKDGTVVKSINIKLPYENTSGEQKVDLVKKSMNISFDSKLRFLSEFFIGKDISIGIRKDALVVDSVYVYTPDSSLCNWRAGSE